MYRRVLMWAVFLLVASRETSFAAVQTIDFEQFTGPSNFTGAQPPLTVGIATFSGGQLLRNTSNLPADQTTVYGTAFTCGGCDPTLTIDFAQPVSGVKLFVANGQTFTVTYTVEDDQGHMDTQVLAANLVSGSGTFELPFVGIRQVTIISNAGSAWDFFIDNISFLQGAPAPALSTWGLLALAMLLLGAGWMGLGRRSAALPTI